MNLTKYLIIHKNSGKALDWNLGAPNHHSLFLWSPTYNAPNHQWIICQEGSSPEQVKIKSPPRSSTEKSDIVLSEAYIWKHKDDSSSSYHTLDEKQKLHETWVLEPVRSSGANVFRLKYVDNGCYLVFQARGSSCASSKPQPDSVHLAPYLMPSELIGTSGSCGDDEWVLYELQDHSSRSTQSSSAVDVDPQSSYMIVNKMTGLALDGNCSAANQVCQTHKRPFVWPVSSTDAKQAPVNHQFQFALVNGNSGAPINEYMIVSLNSRMALDGNENVPQHDAQYPAPFMWAPHPNAPNHRWRLINESGGYYSIENVANGKVLDGNVTASNQLDAKHRAPFLNWKTSNNDGQLWELRKVNTNVASIMQQQQQPQQRKLAFPILPPQKNEVDCAPIDPYMLQNAPVFEQADKQGIKKHFDEQGFVIIRGVLNENEVQETRNYFDEVNKSINWGTSYPRIMMPHRNHKRAEQLLRHPNIVPFVELVMGEECRGAQTMYYFKPPGSRGQSLHQDNFYLKSQPGTCVASWTAIDDADPYNGGMYLAPDTSNYDIQCPGLADMSRSAFPAYVPIPHDKKPLLAGMKAGDVLIFNGNVLHGSGPNNTSDRFRRSFIGHYIPASSQMISEFYLPLVDLKTGETMSLAHNAGGGPCGE